MFADCSDLGEGRNPIAKRFAGGWTLKGALIPDREIGPAPSSLAVLPSAVLETPREGLSREKSRLRQSHCILSVSLCPAVLRGLLGALDCLGLWGERCGDTVRG